MSLEIRPAKLNEMQDFGHAAFTSLVMSSEVMPPETIQGINPEWTLCAFEDGKLATSYAAWPLTMRFSGDAIPVAGITFVGTLPIYRGRSYLRKIIAQHFNMLHEKGEQPIAALYASRAAIYQRYGYAVVTTRNKYTIGPRYLKFAINHPVNGKLRELKDDEFSILVELYRQFREERIGYIHRGKAMWQMNILRPPINPDKILNKIIYEENNKALGYVIYTSEPLASTSGMPRHNIYIRDLVWLNASAYYSIWDYFSCMHLADNIIWDRVPTDDPLPHILLEPRMLNSISHDGLLARIIDVDRSLIKRKYTTEAILRFEIIDDLCQWNKGRWKLETDSNQTHISKTTDNPEIAMPISTLAMLVFSQISATEAARMGRLDVYEESALTKWDSVMRTKYRPFCADLF